MPKPQEWQAAITRHGFHLRIDTDFDASTHSGCLPCEYKGEAAGFEYDYAVLDNEELHELEVPQPLPCMISFSASMRVRNDFLSEVIAAAVLTEITGGLLVDPQEGRRHESADVIRWAKELELTDNSPRALPEEKNPESASSKPWWKFW
jgi:hypothetical protein